MKKVDKAFSETFIDEELDLSGATIINCSFSNCKVTFKKPAWSYGNNFDDRCKFNVSAKEVWKYLVNPL